MNIPTILIILAGNIATTVEFPNMASCLEVQDSVMKTTPSTSNEQPLVVQCFYYIKSKET